MSFCSACTVVVEMSVAYDDDPFPSSFGFPDL